MPLTLDLVASSTFLTRLLPRGSSLIPEPRLKLLLLLPANTICVDPKVSSNKHDQRQLNLDLTGRKRAQIFMIDDASYPLHGISFLSKLMWNNVHDWTERHLWKRRAPILSFILRKLVLRYPDHHFLQLWTNSFAITPPQCSLPRNYHHVINRALEISSPCRLLYENFRGQET